VDAILADIGTDDERATAVIARLRALLRKGDPVRAPLDLNAAVAETAGLVAPDAARRGVALTLDLAPALPPVVGDRVQLQQVVLNLLLNGLDAAAGPGPEAQRPQGDGRSPAGDGPRPAGPRAALTVRTRRAPEPPSAAGPPAETSAAGEEGQEVEVVVEDSGPGLDPAAAGRLFEPFYTTKPSGLGMGLAISHTIAEAHGGALRAANRPAGGAEFTLTLPAAPPPAAPAPQGHPDSRRPAAAGEERRVAG
jgi:signal transduction histidine kinase